MRGGYHFNHHDDLNRRRDPNRWRVAKVDDFWVIGCGSYYLGELFTTHIDAFLYADRMARR